MMGAPCIKLLFTLIWIAFSRFANLSFVAWQANTAAIHVTRTIHANRVIVKIFWIFLSHSFWFSYRSWCQDSRGATHAQIHSMCLSIASLSRTIDCSVAVVIGGGGGWVPIIFYAPHYYPNSNSMLVSTFALFPIEMNCVHSLRSDDGYLP